ncbi:MAG TPA: T9SS type A sorting domain-containing protein, partial [Candidatus Kapabacteria bacterium]|nr:T9SS type A sorting domain-containing protein [Candidatus Kapabacteria bacterium]
NIDGIRPNPAGSVAEVDYTLGNARSISISIYDLLGNEVKQLMDGQPEAEGPHTLQFTSDGLPSGTYYCRVTDGHFVMTKEFEIAK